MTDSSLIETPAAQPGDGAVPVEEDRVLKGGWYTLWVMVSMIFFGAISRQILTVAAAPMAVSLGLSDGQLGMVQGLAFAIFSIVIVYPIAWAADRFDRRIIVAICISACAVGAVACAFAHSFAQLFVAAMAIASVDCGLFSIFTSFSPDLFKGRKRLLANSVIFLASMGSVAVGLALGGSFISLLDAAHDGLPLWLQQFEPWRLAFLLVAAPAPLLLFLLIFTRLRHASPDGTLSASAAQGQRFWPFFRENRVAISLVLAALSLYALGFNGYLGWLPVVTSRLFGATPGENGAGMGIAMGVSVAIGVPAATYILRRMITRMGPVASLRFFWIATTATTPLMLLFLWAGTTTQMFLLFTLVMIVVSGLGSMLFTLLQDIATTALRARMMAIWSILFALVGGNAPTLVGGASEALGSDPHMLLVALTVISLASWIVAAILFRVAERPFAGLLRNIADADSASPELVR